MLNSLKHLNYGCLSPVTHIVTRKAINSLQKKKKKKNCLFQIKGPRGANIIRKRKKETTSIQQYFTSGFIGPQILNFEISISLSLGPKPFLFRLAKFLLEALHIPYCKQLRCKECRFPILNIMHNIFNLPDTELFENCLVHNAIGKHS